MVKKPDRRKWPECSERSGTADAAVFTRMQHGACMGAHGSSSGAPGLGDDARLGDGDIGLGLVTGVGRGGLNLLDDVHALDDPAEDHVTAIEPAESRGTGMRTRGTRIPPQTARRRKAAQEVFSPRSGNSGDEELGTVGVRASVGHGQVTCGGVRQTRQRGRGLRAPAFAVSQIHPERCA